MASLNVLGTGIDTMQILAQRTGGKAFYSRNDIDRAVRHAIDDSRVSYVLGYYPTHNQWDGRFLEIKVKVKRPGLRVRARAGYFAQAETPKLDEKQLLTALRDAARSPLESTSVGLTASALPLEANGKTVLAVALDIDARDITLRREGDRWVGALDFFFAQRSAEGKTSTSVSQTLDMRLTDATNTRLKETGLTFNRRVEIEGQPVVLRVVVRDALSGALGPVSVPLTSNARQQKD